MKRILIFALTFFVLIQIGCANKTNKELLCTIIDQYIYSEDITYTTVDPEGNDFIFHDYKLAQGFLNALLVDKDLNKYKSSKTIDELNNMKHVNILIKRDNNNLEIDIYENGCVCLKTKDYLYYGNKDTVNYKDFSTFSNLNEIYPNDVIWVDSYRNPEENISCKNYTGYPDSKDMQTVESMKSFKLSKKEVITTIKNQIDSLKKSDFDPGTEYENLFLVKNINNGIEQYYSLCFCDLITNTLKNDYYVLLIPTNHFGSNKYLINKYYTRHGSTISSIIHSVPTKDNHTYIHDCGEGGYYYDYLFNPYVICEKDMAEINQLIQNGNISLLEEIDDLKQEIIGWWNS